MTTTPLPPLPVTEHNHPEHAWRWTPTEIRWMDARDAQWQAYATQARADLDAENARMADALLNIQMLIGVYTIEDAAEMARAALESKP
jgi:hypothetical protein